MDSALADSCCRDRYDRGVSTAAGSNADALECDWRGKWLVKPALGRVAHAADDGARVVYHACPSAHRPPQGELCKVFGDVRRADHPGADLHARNACGGIDGSHWKPGANGPRDDAGCRSVHRDNGSD